ncbi:MAG: hypothetical protein LBQ43_02390 [Holosporales bacterium]|nr:hypothetical protein [Holosporales bacterium]
MNYKGLLLGAVLVVGSSWGGPLDDIANKYGVDAEKIGRALYQIHVTNETDSATAVSQLLGRNGNFNKREELAGELRRVWGKTGVKDLVSSMYSKEAVLHQGNSGDETRDEPGFTQPRFRRPTGPKEKQKPGEDAEPPKRQEPVKTDVSKELPQVTLKIGPDATATGPAPGSRDSSARSSGRFNTSQISSGLFNTSQRSSRRLNTSRRDGDDLQTRFVNFRRDSSSSQASLQEQSIPLSIALPAAVDLTPEEYQWLGNVALRLGVLPRGTEVSQENVHDVVQLIKSAIDTGQVVTKDEIVRADVSKLVDFEGVGTARDALASVSNTLGNLTANLCAVADAAGVLPDENDEGLALSELTQLAVQAIEGSNWLVEQVMNLAERVAEVQEDWRVTFAVVSMVSRNEGWTRFFDPDLTVEQAAELVRQQAAEQARQQAA